MLTAAVLQAAPVVVRPVAFGPITNLAAAATPVSTGKSLSSHYIQVTFKSAVDGSGDSLSNYTLGKPAKSAVKLTAVTVSADRRSAVLTTSQQAKEDYKVTFGGQTTKAFAGSTTAENYVTSAVAKSNTTIVVSYSKTLSIPGVAGQYSLGTGGPAVTKATLNADKKSVTLTTASQSAKSYTLSVFTPKTADGLYLDPTRGSVTLTGMATPVPAVATATATSNHFIKVAFTVAVGASADSADGYVLAGPSGSATKITAVAVAADRKSAVLTTTEQKAGTYTIRLNLAGQTAKSFSGSTVAESYLMSAKATSNTQITLTFSKAMASDATNLNYYAFGESGPKVTKATLSSDKKTVTFTTASQWVTDYSVAVAGLKGSDGIVMDPTRSASAEFLGVSRIVASDGVAPRVVGAVSKGNNKVLVAFSEMMDATAVVPQHYSIVRKDGSLDAGVLPVIAAKFTDPSQKTIELTTASQSQATYGLTVVNVRDGSGSVMASPTPTAGGVYDPTKASFAGTPPVVTTLIDTDKDGLTDDVEVRGWAVTVIDVDGTKTKRTVTSDPAEPDSDDDGLNDYQEANIRTDPRNADTDDDQLGDYAEFNETYSNPLAQDSDGDTLDDFLEFSFFKTSPIQEDTDGDQFRDDYEIAGNRNPRVSDLPRPEISVGSVNLQLNVQFSETNDQQKRDLETKTVASTLTQSADQSFTRSDTINAEAHLDAGTKDGADVPGPYFRAGASLGYSFNQTASSATSTQAAYENSLSTDREVTRGFTVQRNVAGATMQVAINLRNLSSIAYQVKNLQVTAFIQDPQDHSKLTPVATLLPDAEPEKGYTLGPLVADKGPLIFSNSSIVPSLVESLMANSSGLIFRISNYDIIDEKDRNFAFTSQEIVERTSRLVIDYGGASSMRALLGGKAFDELKPGDETEIFRIATSAGRLIDTNGDDVIDANDHTALFDGAGKEAGITLFEALNAAGLKQYDEAKNRTSKLSQAEILGSFSTYFVPAEVVNGVSYPARHKIFRIRGISNDAINKKYWEIINTQAIDQTADVRNLILKTDSPVSLNFVQDLDRDGLSADVEYFLRTSDSPLPVGAQIPNTTDSKNNSVLFGTDPQFNTGDTVRVYEKGKDLLADTNYYVRNLGGGAYSFYYNHADAYADGTAGLVKLTGKVTTGIYAASELTVREDNKAFSLSGVRIVGGSYPTGTIVQATHAGYGIKTDTNYYLRNLGNGDYSLYTSAQSATDGKAPPETPAGEDLPWGEDPSGIVIVPDSLEGGLFDPIAKGRDTDGDGLDDRFESLIGWTVTTPQRTYQTYSSPNRADSNFDAPAFGANSDNDTIEDRLEYSGSDLDAAPAGWEDKAQDTDNDGIIDTEPNGLRDRFEIFQLPEIDGKTDYVLDPLRKDTDNDGINDATEVIGFKITPITGERPYWRDTIPTTPFTDADTFSDGLERVLGLDPRDDKDTDKDGDGLPDKVEEKGWTVYNFGVSSEGYVQGKYLPDFNPDLTPVNTDVAVNVLTFEDEFDPKISRYSLVYVVGGGLEETAPKDKEGNPDNRYFLGKLVNQPDANVTQYGLYAKASDAAAGISTGLVDLKQDVTYIQLANESRKKSRTNAVDSDSDGLTDYEEFFLGTDPSSADSDSDGVADRTELLGYTLGHDVNGSNLGIIKTDPLDADTDNDKLSDGAEAELVDVEQKRWIVRVAGDKPYRVYSNPLVADADFDNLVDGDERVVYPLVADPYKNRTDPFKNNTDGDKRSDDVEVAAKTNPLAADIQVTVVAQRFESPAGAFEYGLSVRKPDASGTAGLSAAASPVLDDKVGGVGTVKISMKKDSGADYAAFVYFKWLDAAGTEHSTEKGSLEDIALGANNIYRPGDKNVPAGARFRVYIDARTAAGGNTTTPWMLYIPGAAEASFEAAGHLADPTLTTVSIPTAERNLTQRTTFGLATGGNFSIEGYFKNAATGNAVALGGLNGLFGSQPSPTGGSATLVRTVFSYTDVQNKFIQDYTFETTIDGSKATLKFIFIIA